MEIFICENCKGVFVVSQPEKDLQAEYVHKFKVEFVREETVQVCDECFDKIEQWHKANPPH